MNSSMDFDAILDRAIAAIEAAKPRKSSTSRQIYTFVLDKCVAGFSTRKDGVTYVLLTSWWDGKNWLDDSYFPFPNGSLTGFCKAWLGIRLMDPALHCQIASPSLVQHEIRVIFPAPAVPPACVDISVMLWAAPSSTRLNSILDLFVQENTSAAIVLLANQSQDDAITFKQLKIAPHAVVEDEKADD